MANLNEDMGITHQKNRGLPLMILLFSSQSRAIRCHDTATHRHSLSLLLPAKNAFPDPSHVSKQLRIVDMMEQRKIKGIQQEQIVLGYTDPVQALQSECIPFKHHVDIRTGFMHALGP